MKTTRTLTASACMLLAVAALAGCGGTSGSPQAGTSSGSQAKCTPAHPGVPTISKGTLTVLVYVSPPYTTKQGTSYGGVDGTIVKELAKMECLTLKEQSVAPAALIASIQAQRGDVAIGGIYYTSQRAKTLSLSAPMYRDGMAVLSKASLNGSLAALKGKRVGVIQGYLWDADIQKALGSGNVQLYQDGVGMVTDVENGRLYAGILTNAEAGYRAKQNPALKVANFQSTPEVAASQGQNNVVLASPKQEAALTKALDADIKKLVSNGAVAAALKANGMDPGLAGPASS